MTSVQNDIRTLVLVQADYTQQYFWVCEMTYSDIPLDPIVAIFAQTVIEFRFSCIHYKNLLAI